MSASPSVSVIVPVHNAAPYLEDMVSSVLAQTLDARAWELLLIDDGSTDASPDILRRYSDAHENISSQTIPASGSASAPRNLGIDLARGEYIFFLDADDVLAPETLEALLSCATETGSDIVLCRMEHLTEVRRPIPRAVFTQERRQADFVESLAYRTLGPTKLYRRSLLMGHHIRFPLGYFKGEDQPFTMRAYLKANHISAIADRGYYFVRTLAEPRSASQRRQAPHQDLQKNLDLISEVIEGTNPGPRRDLLLRRPVIEPAGLISALRRPFAEMTLADANALVAQFQSVRDAWSDRLRADASDEVRLKLDLAFSGRVEELQGIAWTVSHHRPLPLSLTPAGFVYEHLGEEPIEGLRGEARLVGVRASESGMRLDLELPAIQNAPHTCESAVVRWRSDSGARVESPCHGPINFGPAPTVNTIDIMLPTGVPRGNYRAELALSDAQHELVIPLTVVKSAATAPLALRARSAFVTASETTGLVVNVSPDKEIAAHGSIVVTRHARTPVGTFFLLHAPLLKRRRAGVRSGGRRGGAVRLPGARYFGFVKARGGVDVQSLRLTVAGQTIAVTVRD